MADWLKSRYFCSLKESCGNFNEKDELCALNANKVAGCKFFKERVLEILANNGHKENTKCKYLGLNPSCTLFKYNKLEKRQHVCETNPLECEDLISSYYMESGKCKYLMAILKDTICKEDDGNGWMVDRRHISFKCAVGETNTFKEEVGVVCYNKNESPYYSCQEKLCIDGEKRWCPHYSRARRKELGIV